MFRMMNFLLFLCSIYFLPFLHACLAGRFYDLGLIFCFFFFSDMHIIASKFCFTSNL